MSFADNDSPLGEDFMANPYEFLQSFVRNMNNQVFLSEYQLSHLYALLLLRKESPWDQLKPNSPNLKAEVDEMVNKKVNEVKRLLESLSQVYQQKVKKNTFNQIQRLMNILKAKNKSIYIEKDLHSLHQTLQKLKGPQGRLFKHLVHEEVQSQSQKSLLDLQKEKSNEKIKVSQTSQTNQKNDCQCQTTGENTQNVEQMSKKVQNEKLQQSKQQPKQQKSLSHTLQMMNSQNSGDEREVLSLFYGIANLPNLSSLALGNCLEYSAAERFIKFKMSKNYIMTIKNEDQMCFDRTSVLRNVSGDLYTHHIFPYLTAVELFKVRGVCKQWMENVKEAWHSTFKREMFIQLMACEFCKEIEFYYKLIQLRNPFFQKVSLLMHALLQIIQWDRVYESVQNNTILPQLKKVLIILLKLLGEQITIPNLNSITEEVWLQHKAKTLTLKQRLSTFLNNIDSSGLNIIQLIKVKLQLLDDPFMRVQELNSQDKTPLLLVIFIKQLTLQQILKSHIYFSQEYLMNTKRKLDNISSKMPQQKGFLQGVYKVLLLRNLGGKNQKEQEEQDERSQMPNFSEILSSIFSGNDDMEKPDFVIKHKTNYTNIYMDKATKLDIIVSTVKKMNAFESFVTQSKIIGQVQKSQDIKSEQQSERNMAQKIQQEGSQNEGSRSQLKTMNIYSINIGQESKSQQQSQSKQQFQSQHQEKK